MPEQKELAELIEGENYFLALDDRKPEPFRYTYNGLKNFEDLEGQHTFATRMKGTLTVSYLDPSHLISIAEEEYGIIVRGKNFRLSFPELI
jgi:hypothetical protein